MKNLRRLLAEAAAEPEAGAWRDDKWFDLAQVAVSALPALLDVAEAAAAQPQYNKKALRAALARLEGPR